MCHGKSMYPKLAMTQLFNFNKKSFGSKFTIVKIETLNLENVIQQNLYMESV